jgi:hypothetical protein
MGKSKIASLIIVILSIPFMLSGCGGSGGGSGNGDSSSSMGTAAVLIKDAPTEEYDSIVLCISKATLEPGSVTVFESDSCVDVDLLDHQEKPFLLTVKDIPAGTYNQIRLKVDEIFTEGGSCDGEDIKIPGGYAKIYLKEPTKIKSGDKIAIDIDIHAKRSVNLYSVCDSDYCIFRPVILAEIKNLSQIPPQNKCPRILKGTIFSIKEVEGEVKGFKLRLAHDPKSRINIKVDKNTIIFDENGDFTTPDALEVGQKVKLRGTIQKDASILASFVAIGDLLILHGTALSDLYSQGGDLKFEMKLDPFQAITDYSIDVIVENQTVILIDCNTEVTDDAIKPGVGVRAIGKLSLSKGDLISVVLFLEEQKTFGIIESMRDEGSYYELKFKPAGETNRIFIDLPYDAKVILEGDGTIKKDLLEELVNCKPRKAHITLNKLDPTVADFVAVKDEVIEGIIKYTNPSSRKIILKGDPETIIQVQKFAKIIRNGKLISFNQLQYGDEIRVFGLETCQADEIDFYGFVVLIIDCEKKGDEGCSQGYWKNHSHSWGPTGYRTFHEYNKIFHVPYYKTLLEALNSGGGGEYALGRQAVAALLNASHPHVDYYYTEHEVIKIVQDAYKSGNFENAKNRLEKHNDRSNCPLN